jgi:hypothetical protein
MGPLLTHALVASFFFNPLQFLSHSKGSQFLHVLTLFSFFFFFFFFLNVIVVQGVGLRGKLKGKQRRVDWDCKGRTEEGG